MNKRDPFVSKEPVLFYFEICGTKYKIRSTEWGRAIGKLNRVFLMNRIPTVPGKIKVDLCLSTKYETNKGVDTVDYIMFPEREGSRGECRQLISLLLQSVNETHEGFWGDEKLLILKENFYSPLLKIIHNTLRLGGNAKTDF